MAVGFARHTRFAPVASTQFSAEASAKEGRVDMQVR